MERNGTVGSTSLPQALQPALSQVPARHANPEVVGKSFEGMFASMLIKQMRQTLDGGLFGNDPSDVLGGLFDHFLGTHIAQAGGFGVGDMIRRQLESRAERTQTA